MANTGDDVVQSLSGPFRKVYDTVTKYLGDPSAPASKNRDVMKSIPDDNPNKRAWEEATKFRAKPSPLTNKNLGTRKRATKGKASQKKTAAKR